MSSNKVKPSCIAAPPDSCVSTIFGLIGVPTVGDVDEPRHAHLPCLGIDLDLGAGAADHPERRRILRLAGVVSGG